MRKFITDILAKTNLGVEQNAYVLGTVGIGTASPSYKLHVEGTIYSPTYTSGGITINSGDFLFSAEGGGDGFQMDYYNGQMYLGNNAGTSWHMVMQDNGNIGIGTTSPTDKLQVVASTYNGITITTPDVATFKMRSTSGTTSWGFATTNLAANDFGIYQSNSGGGDPINAGTARLYFNGSGNVGIGTTAPISKLQVNGQFRQLYSRAFISNPLDSDGYAGHIIVNSNNANGDLAGIGLYTNSSYNAAAGLFALQESSTAASMVFYAGSNLATERMRITSSGNVGIGTTSPVGKLSILVDGASTWSQYIQTPLTGNKRNSIGFHDYTGSNIAAILTDVNANNTADFGISVPNGSPRLVITSSGNVGIGTTSPYGRLELNGSGQTWPTAPAIRMWDSFNSKGWLVGSANNYTAGDFYIRTLPSVSGDPGAGQQEFTIKHASGNVGIGTTSPGFKLDVSGVAGDWAGRFSSNASASAYFAHGGGYGAYIDAGTNATSATYLMSLVSNGSTRMYVRGDGAVGIGTGSPSLESAGIGLDILNSSYTQLRVRSSSSSAGIEMTPGAGKRWEIQANTSSNWFVYDRTDQLYRFLIDYSGNVVINDTSAYAKLDVRGQNVLLYRPSVNASAIYSAANNTYSWQFGINDGADFVITGGGFAGLGTETFRIASAGAATFSYSVTASSNITSLTNLGFVNTNASQAGFVADYTGTGAVKVSMSTYNNIFQVYNETSGYSIFNFTPSTKAFVINPTGGNVGIGTTSPLSPLHQVGGGGNYTGEARFGGSSTAFGIELKYTQAGSTLGSIYTSPTYSSADILFKLGAGLGNENQLVLKGNGNVGIGTTSPADTLSYGKALDIQSSTGAAIYLRDSDATSVYGLFAYDGGGINRTNIGGIGANNYVRIISAGNEAIRIDASSNVGIGTTSPTEKLAVAGRITLSGSEFSFSGDEDKNITVFSNRLLNLRTNDITRLTITGSGNVGIGTSSPSAKLQVEGDGIVINTENVAAAKFLYFRYSNGADVRSDSFLTFSTSGSPTERMRITSAGNVGIGTTDPQKPLEVITSASNFASVGVNALAIGEWTGIHFGYRESNSLYRKSAIVFQRTGSAAEGSIHFLNNNDADNSSATLANSRMVITSAGNVGIGTSSPSSILQLGSGSYTTTNSSYNSFNSGGFGVLFRNDYDAYITFNTVYGASGWVNKYSAYKSAVLNFNDGALDISTGTGITAGSASNLTSRLTMTNGGNVGIGTTSPVTGLDVRTSPYSNTTARFGTARPVYIINDDPIIGFNQYYNSGWKAGTTGYSGNVGLSSAGEMYFNVSTSSVVTDNIVTQREVMRILNNGNVGIGTTSPGAMLDIYHATNGYASVGLQGYSTAAKWFLTSGISGDTIQDFSISHNNNGTSPVFRLSNSTGAATFSNLAGTGTRMVVADANGLLSTQAIGSGAITGSGTTNYLPKFTGTSTIGNSQLFDNGSNVGVGTDAPSALLTVSSVGFDDTYFRVEQRRGGYASAINLVGATDAGAIYNRISSQTNGGTTHWQIGGGAVANTMAFYTGGNLRATLNASGNLGLGVTPSAWFSTWRAIEIGGADSNVAGNGTGPFRLLRNAYIDAGGTWIYKNTGEASFYQQSTGNHIWYSAPSGTAGNSISFTPLMTLNASGNVSIGNTNDTYKLDVSGTVRVNGSNPAYRTDNTTSYTSLVSYLSGTRSWQLDNVSNDFWLYMAGSLNTYVLKIAASTGAATFSSSVTATNMVLNNTTNDAADTLRIYRGTSGGYQYQSAIIDAVSGDTNLRNIATDSARAIVFSFSTNGASSYTERMRITSAGNVGIGTTSPATKFHVVGSRILVEDTNAGIMFRTGGVDRYSVASNGGAFQIYDEVNLTNRLYITSTGNVGIGTTSPNAKLEVVGNINTRGLYFYDGGNSGTLRIDNSYGGGIDYHADQNGHRFFTWVSGTGWVQHFTITDAGNVGIGTTSPAYKLDVATGNDNAIRILNSSGSNNNGLALSVGSGTPWLDFYGGRFDIKYNTSPGSWNSGANTFLSILSSGNVGIGTTSPNYKLHVSGNAYINETLFVNQLTTIEDSLIVYDNLGVGTTTPSSKFHVVTGTTGNIAIFQGGAGRYIVTGTDGSGQYIEQVGNSSGERILRIQNSNGSGAYTQLFLDGGNQRIYTSTNVNVGIGTTSPGAKFQVSGGDGIINNAFIGEVPSYTSANAQFSHTSRAVAGEYSFLSANDGETFINSKTGYNIRFRVNNNDKVIINSAGNVGIGTTSPSEILHVKSPGNNGGVRYIVFLGQNSTGYQNSFVASVQDELTDLGAGIVGTNTGSNLSFSTHPNGGALTERMRITKTGNVGIGTTGPSYNLHVEGNTSGISIYASHDIAAFSDITVKKEVKRIENAIEKVKEMNGYTYVRTDDETGTRRAGVIAQEVQKVLPEVVSANPDGTLNVAYSNMVALLIEGMKEQQATIERLENRIKMLEK
jgi:hypothetical protein